MKKILVSVLIIGIVRIMGLFYFDAQLLNKPIPLAQDADLSSYSINISYITNRYEPDDLAYVVIDDYSFQPESNFYFPFFNATPMTTAQNYSDYKFHSIYTARLPIHDDNELIKKISQQHEVTLHFKNGHIMTVPLNVKPSITTGNTFKYLNSSSGSDGNYQRYSVRKAFTLNDVQINTDRAKIEELKINDKVMDLPLKQPITLQQNDVIYVAISDGVAYYLGELFFIEFTGKNSKGENEIIQVIQNLNSHPTEQLINEVVKEQKGK